jgi:CDP-paratose 2-epimerase
MTRSIKEPELDFEVNALGTFNLLNAIKKHSPYSKIIYSSTNKVYGDLNHFTYTELNSRYICKNKPLGFDEHTKIDLITPYGVSKGSADHYMLDFAKMYEINTLVFRHSSIYGERQFATLDQGWIAWFVKKALDIKNQEKNQILNISGNGKQVRDLLYVGDCVDLYIKASQKINEIKGQVFNIGGGVENSFSLLELFNFLEYELKVKIKISKSPQRQSDQKIFIADITKAKNPN